MNTHPTAYSNLIEHLALLTDTHEIEAILSALLTDKEQQDITNRILIFDLLDKSVTQRAISQKLGVGIATVSRGAKAMKNQNNQAISHLLATHRKI